MKRLLLIGLILLTLTAFGQDTIKPVRLTYHHGIQLNKIDEPGIKFVFIQRCLTTIDSIITSGKIKFNHSTVGLIKDCSYEFCIVQDTLTKIGINTLKKEKLKCLIIQRVRTII